MNPTDQPTDSEYLLDPSVDQPVLGLTQKFIDQLDLTASRSSHAQAAFLDVRRSGLEELARLIEMQLQANRPAQTALLSREQLEEFATGSIVRCFGPDFSVLEGRRYPRIPNTDLLLMDRVLSVQGTRNHLDSGKIQTEFDIPADAWFYAGYHGRLPPYMVLMEMALQPCGLLSAYLGTSLRFPKAEFFFRNLDGSATILADLDLRGKTVVNHSQLLSTTISSATIIQKFSFSMSCQGQEFYRGESIFGYFPGATMQNQVGLDGKIPANSTSKPPTPAKGALGYQSLKSHPRQPAPRGSLDFLDEIDNYPSDSDHPDALIRASQQIHPGDWFYSCHFYQDPVMPGSIGVEAIFQALKIYISKITAGKNKFSNLSFPVNQPVSWKYRGQILPTNQRMSLEIQINFLERSSDRISLSASASVWADKVRIYEIKGISLSFSLDEPERK